ncbi:MAG: Asp-tRNA(Asn)/Glu-tRNA(Gln) amidotransferase subunit GatC [Minisyncoccia bacterium]|jgi:aspartyl-tRNA(Asn)/glutamyl-tRNA(Gln) amidotransferase subunit C
MILNIKDVEHIAELARIKLTGEEKEKMAEDLGQILDYINKLKEIKTDGVEPTAQVTGLENAFRKDETTPADPEQRQKIIDEFPHKKDDFLKVRAVFGEKES